MIGVNFVSMSEVPYEICIEQRDGSGPSRKHAAPTVSTILDRNYVKKEGKYLTITNLGHAVTGWMEQYFTDIADLKFTANMEKKLDDLIASEAVEN